MNTIIQARIEAALRQELGDDLDRVEERSGWSIVQLMYRTMQRVDLSDITGRQAYHCSMDEVRRCTHQCSHCKDYEDNQK